MNILNKLKPTLLVMSIMLLSTVSYAADQDQGEHPGTGLTEEEYNKAVEESLQNEVSMPNYPNLEDSD